MKRIGSNAHHAYHMRRANSLRYLQLFAITRRQLHPVHDDSLPKHA